ncbi:alpha-ketoacid dehydrogenase subunit beta [Rubrobacter taiwanensis]|jgi:pyruvate/2-oxoglutarate/acetoin dehydrogenase E1 component|uniref:Alpha-ketoacid dehydrogenase subunit beta n=1 Tax=Rubrobacter taiwanensis TaxID=185139 RepID=A0A4R1BN48_9ACTN|nr:alpha-ketoacid dehydrogenase subunit beta [Rubrobacter taiwanensis]TCJ18899.1 alpha-ketoacid dehydrogenase subunit beta [Rubrobacter taiwanensis]
MPEARVITYREAVREAMVQAMRHNEEVFLMGEDVGVYGGAFGVSRGMVEEFGEDRVVDTPLSEAGFVGLCTGAALLGMRPIAEIQFSDFITHCMDQLVNQAAKVRYMFGGEASVPLVVRTPGGAGTGAAAQHSQSLEAWFVHVPGLKVVMPSTPYDAKGLLLAALDDPNPVIFYEHKLLYNRKGEVPEDLYRVPLGEAALSREGEDVTLVAAGLMHHYALEAADALSGEGVEAEVIDLRTLSPMDHRTVARSVEKTGKLVVVEEDVKTCGWGAEVVSRIVESESFYALDRSPARVAAADVPIPYNRRLEAYVRPTPEKVVEAVKALLDARVGVYA